MFRTILVPLDGSELAERALPYATALAATTSGGKVVLARVALAPAPATLDGATWEQDQTNAVAEAEQYLSGVAEKIGTRVAVEIIVPYGWAAACIVDAITETGADAVVMATHGRTGLRHLLVGSVAEAVIASSTVPVFVTCPHQGEMPQAPFHPARARVVVPLDGSTFAEAALPTALDLLGAGGELILLTVVEPPQHVERDEYGRVRAYLDQQEEALTREARDYLHSVAENLVAKRSGLDIRIEVRVGEPAAGVTAVAADRSADLVVMASHGRTGIARAVFGSVTGGVLREGFTPVLVVHSRVPAAPPEIPEPIDHRMALHF